MNNVTANIPVSIQKYLNGQSNVKLKASNIRDALVSLDSNASSPGLLRDKFFDSNGNINRFVRIFINGHMTPLGSNGKELIEEGDEFTIVLALAGG